VASLRLDGKTIVLMGAGGGNMGAATSLALGEAGANVVGVDQTDDAMAGLEARVAELGGRFVGVTADVRRTDEIDRILAKAVETFGALDGLVNLVGGTQVGQWKRFEETSDAIWEAVMALNLDYVFKSCRAFGRYLIESGRPGSIVNFASISGYSSAPYHGPYGAAKAGVMALTKTMAVEWGERNIRVNCLAPSGSRGPRARAMLADDTAQRKSRAVLPRDGQATDFANTTVYLLSDVSSWITGAVLYADGGMSAQSPLGDKDFFTPMLG